MKKKKYKPNYVRIINKLFSIAFIGLGLTSLYIEKDATFLIFTSIIGVPLFFSRYNTMGV